ncbi:hypothetical protein [Mariprofundus ferrooxydans]|uniref:hypothetical protein n=1 Tax=Mariprofundus ferrooxydans TaxID=314344 RepID=UPI001430B801|nr:hypothetical protein [Mariprofundus ferrooxydans]
MSDVNEFYLQDSRTLCGNNVVFWRKKGNGYGTNLDELEVYSLEDAQHMHDFRCSDIPLLKSLVDKKSIMAVDHQVIPAKDSLDVNDEYVVQRVGHYNGNDIRFVGVDGETYDYNKARVFTGDIVNQAFAHSDCYAIYSKEEMDRVARRTFQAHNIDKKAMITKPGIKLSRPKRSRPTTGKSRGNCPTCGKITWDYNPHENAPCTEHRGW